VRGRSVDPGLQAAPVQPSGWTALAGQSLTFYVRAAMPNDWRAAMTYLERTDPEHWSRRDRVAHSGQVRTSAPEIPDDHERMAQVVARLREAGALPDDGEEG
jgi:hypothetical protein